MAQSSQYGGIARQFKDKASFRKSWPRFENYNRNMALSRPSGAERADPARQLG
jgi:hypothetical protein